MEASKSTIVMIKVKNLLHHPENPRKSIGDIAELTESVKKNGIMQNLTVTPASIKDNYLWNGPADKVSTESDFYVIIGNRRLEAARAAGLEEVPCVIVTQIDIKGQLGIMLEENLQRTDLTVYEQAQGFQMMLDLGDTVDTIAEKTGFSRTTIYHRVNLAKLDQELLKKAEKNEEFQLSFTDLIELEKIKSIEKRNEVLKNARNSGDLKYRAKTAAEEEKRLEHRSVLLTMFKFAEIPEDKNAYSWRSNYTEIKTFSYNEEPPKQLEYEPYDYAGDLVYNEGYASVTLYERTEEEKTQKESAEHMSAEKQAERAEYERRQEEKRESLAKVEEIRVKILDDMERVIKKIILNLEESSCNYVHETMWELLIRWDISTAAEELNTIMEAMELCDELSPEEEREIENYEEFLTERRSEISMEYQMLLFLFDDLKTTRLSNYDGTYKKGSGDHFKRMQEILAGYADYSFANVMEECVVDGTSRFYLREEN